MSTIFSVTGSVKTEDTLTVEVKNSNSVQYIFQFPTVQE